MINCYLCGGVIAEDEYILDIHSSHDPPHTPLTASLATHTQIFVNLISNEVSQSFLIQPGETRKISFRNRKYGFQKYEHVRVGWVSYDQHFHVPRCVLLQRQPLLPHP